MAINDKAVVTAAQGYVFAAPVGTAAPTPAELKLINPITYGAQVQKITLTGSATSGTFTVTVDGDTTVALNHNATAAQVQAAVEALDAVGEGNVFVTGSVQAGLFLNFIGALQSQELDLIVVEDSALVGASPVLTASITTNPNGWENLGHTSADELPEFGFEGGDAEVRRTWQNTALREVVTEQAADYVTMQLHQFDTKSFELYYGVDAAQGIPGVFGVNGGVAAPNERAFLIIIVDGDVSVGFYATKASVRRDDAINMPIDEFTSFPIRATFLKHGANRLFDWINEDLFD